MTPYINGLRICFAGLTMLGAIGGAANARAQSVASKETVLSVRRMLERLPYYGVFDFIAFGVDRGTVTLAGYSYQGSLKADAERAVKRVSGVDDVSNKIEVLPASPNDDRIRWATFYRIYADDFLSRYAPGGVGEVRNGRTMLLGVVDSAADRQLAEVRAREVTGVFEVENGLTVVR